MYEKHQDLSPNYSNLVKLISVLPSKSDFQKALKIMETLNSTSILKLGVEANKAKLSKPKCLCNGRMF